MKQSIILILVFIFIANASQAQLFSSGNNAIVGANVGIGINNPSAKLHIKNTVSGELLRMENSSPTGFGKFTLFNDNSLNYATFTKYGSASVGGYAGVTTQYPFANLLAFGNNGGAFLLANSGNVGLALYKGGTTKLKLNVNYNTEYLGLGGNADPTSNVHINSAFSGDTVKITNSSTGHTQSDGLDIRTVGNSAAIINRENSTLDLGTNNTSQMRIAADGKISMGSVTTPTGYRLYVENGILTEKVKVSVKTSAEWSDYVFAPEYKLTKLPEVEAYINSHKHLPGVPSADEVVANGIDMAKMDAKLLEKVEELTLHLIEMNKKMIEMQQKINQLEKK